MLTNQLQKLSKLAGAKFESNRPQHSPSKSDLMFFRGYHVNIDTFPGVSQSEENGTISEDCCPSRVKPRLNQPRHRADRQISWHAYRLLNFPLHLLIRFLFSTMSPRTKNRSQSLRTAPLLTEMMHTILALGESPRTTSLIARPAERRRHKSSFRAAQCLLPLLFTSEPTLSLFAFRLEEESRAYWALRYGIQRVARGCAIRRTRIDMRLLYS